MVLLKSELSKEELEDLKSSIMRFQRKEIIFYFVFIALFFAVFVTLPILKEFLTERDTGVSLRIALENTAAITLAMSLIFLARYYPYFFKKNTFR